MQMIAHLESGDLSAMRAMIRRYNLYGIITEEE
jgi:hypothetical protein